MKQNINGAGNKVKLLSTSMNPQIIVVLPVLKALSIFVMPLHETHLDNFVICAAISDSFAILLCLYDVPRLATHLRQIEDWPLLLSSDLYDSLSSERMATLEICQVDPVPKMVPGSIVLVMGRSCQLSAARNEPTIVMTPCQLTAASYGPHILSWPSPQKVSFAVS